MSKESVVRLQPWTAEQVRSVTGKRGTEVLRRLAKNAEETEELQEKRRKSWRPVARGRYIK